MDDVYVVSCTFLDDTKTLIADVFAM